MFTYEYHVGKRQMEKTDSQKPKIKSQHGICFRQSVRSRTFIRSAQYYCYSEWAVGVMSSVSEREINVLSSNDSREIYTISFPH